MSDVLAPLLAAPEVRAARARTDEELRKVRVLMSSFADLDDETLARSIARVVGSGGIDALDNFLSMVEVAAGAWRELAAQAEIVALRVSDVIIAEVEQRGLPAEGGLQWRC
jgi:hypothetical protein